LTICDMSGLIFLRNAAVRGNEQTPSSISICHVHSSASVGWTTKSNSFNPVLILWGLPWEFGGQDIAQEIARQVPESHFCLQNLVETEHIHSGDSAYLGHCGRFHITASDHFYCKIGWAQAIELYLQDCYIDGWESYGTIEVWQRNQSGHNTWCWKKWFYDDQGPW
jgi:hypothetical protein